MTIAIIIILGLLYVYCEYRQQSAINQLKKLLDKKTEEEQTGKTRSYRIPLPNDQEVLSYVKYVVEQLKNNKEALTFSEWNR